MNTLREIRHSMKVALPLIAFVIISLAGGCQSVYDIKFSTSTRGYTKEIVITPKIITLHELNAREPDKEKNLTWEIKKEDWKKVLQSLDGVMLRELPLLKAPSNKRNSDAARASTFTITDKKAKIWYHYFDDEEPNEELMPLMKVITELVAGK